MRLAFTIWILIIGSCPVLSQKSSGEKDPLLNHYSIEQIKKMSFEQRVNERRRLMNKDTVTFTVEDVKYDRYGIELVYPTNVSDLIKSIDQRVSEIDSLKSNYRIDIFPNTYVDIINRFDKGFYIAAVARKLRYKEYETIKYDDGDEFDFDVNVYSNNSRRMYYFDENRQLRLIVTETGKNVNEGKEYDWPFPLKYTYSAYYIWNDSLQFSKKITEGIPFSWSAVESGYYERDSTIASKEESYFFKNNCIKNKISKGEVSRETWRTDIQRFTKQETECFDNFPAILVRNYIEEYKERHKNSYLKPTKSSVAQPSIVERDE